MSRNALGLHRLAVLAAALGLGACVGLPDGTQPPYRTAALIEAGAGSACTVEDLAVAATFVPLEDDASRVVAIYGGEPLCIASISAVGPGMWFESDPIEDETGRLGGEPFAGTPLPQLDDPPGWDGRTGALFLKTEGGPPEGNTPRTGSITTPGGVVQDPTPQPARPGEKTLSITPPPPGPGSSDN